MSSDRKNNCRHTQAFAVRASDARESDKVELSEVIAGWKEISSWCEDAEIEYSSVEAAGGGAENVEEYTWKRSGTDRLLLWEGKVGGVWKGEVAGENRGYSFQLRRADRNRPWTLLQLEMKTEGEVRGVNGTQLDVTARTAGGFPIQIDVASGVDLLSSPCVVLDDLSRANNLVHLTFHVREDKVNDAKALGFRYRQAALTLDPTRNFAIVRSDWVDENGDHVIREREYVNSDDSSQRSLACKWRGFHRNKQGKESSLSLTEVKTVKLGTRVNPEEFRLSAFGLPEPGEILVDQRGKSWWWIGSGGLVIVLAGLWVYRRQRAA